MCMDYGLLAYWLPGRTGWGCLFRVEHGPRMTAPDAFALQRRHWFGAAVLVLHLPRSRDKHGVLEKEVAAAMCQFKRVAPSNPKLVTKKKATTQCGCIGRKLCLAWCHVACVSNSSYNEQKSEQSTANCDK